MRRKLPTFKSLPPSLEATMLTVLSITFQEILHILKNTKFNFQNKATNQLQLAACCIWRS